MGKKQNRQAEADDLGSRSQADRSSTAGKVGESEAYLVARDTMLLFFRVTFTKHL